MSEIVKLNSISTEKKPKGFQKGDPRINRRGRPPGGHPLKVWGTELLMEEIYSERYKQKMARGKEIILQLLESKNPRAIELVFNYIYGKPKQQVDVDITGDIDLTSLSIEELVKLAEGT